VGVCLNNDYDGGEFVLYNPEEPLPKETGIIYTFPSQRIHEVKKIIKGERWSIIGFLHIDNLDLQKKSLI
jgi:predicted 2-oxoglutarate/Fe(II)-dependent dioxygenase YbiX